MKLLDVKQQLPAGLADETGEFYLSPDGTDIKLSYAGRQFSFEDFPESILTIVNEDMEKNPIAVQALIDDFGLLDIKSQMKQYLACRHGSFDMKPDIGPDRKMQTAEYVDCGRRGKCAAEGKLCPALTVKNGFLSGNEILVLRAIGYGLLDKEIEEETGFSVHTIRNYKDSIARKTGVLRKPALGGLAVSLGLVKNDL